MTQIEWVQNDDGTRGKTWNPTRGCSRVSPGCDNCYAMGQAHRFSGPGKITGNGVAPQRQGKPGPYHGLTTIRKGKVDWSGKVRFVPEMLDLPLRTRKPTKFFVDSMSDLFHQALTNEEIAAVFGVMAACPQHTFQVLTKRAERLPKWFEWYEGNSRAGATPYAAVLEALSVIPVFADWHLGAERVKRAVDDTPWPLPNVWIGVSAEDQQRADERIPHLLATPAAIRFVSAEPLLGPIDFTDLVRHDGGEHHFDALSCDVGPEDDEWGGATLDWVIVGGESGHGARACDVQWIRDIVDQCRSARVAVFTKQIANQHDRKGGDPQFWPPGDWPREFPKVSQ